MEFRLKKQRGYLLIVALVLLVVISFLGVTLVQMFSSSTASTSNITQSNRALYVATSGLEIAKRDIVVNKLRCDDINGTSHYTNAEMFGGQFSVIGTPNATADSLFSNVSTTSNVIELNDASSFAESGIVRIDDEIIGYHKKSGHDLIQLTRGERGTAIVNHNASSSITQVQCMLTATGTIPNLNASQGKRTVRQILEGTPFSLDPNHRSAATATGPVDMAGSSTVNNPSVTTSDPDYPGSTITSSDTVDITGGSQTQVGDGSGGVTTSSNKDATQPDVMENYGEINPSNLFSYFFNEPKNVIRANADLGYNADNIDGATGKTIWVDGNLTFNGNGVVNIGTDQAPVILIVDGDINMTGGKNVNLHGFLYVTGAMKMNAGGDFSCTGAIASEGEMKFGGNKITTLSPTNLDILATINPYAVINYSAHSVGFYEIFH